MRDLGLAPGVEYLAFDFWAKQLLGPFRDSLVTGPVDSAFQVQVLCLRARQPHPQLLATNRHVSCGGVDLERVNWSGDVLSGVSRIVVGDDYALYLTEPEGWTVESVEAAGATVVLGDRREGWRRVTLHGAPSGPLSWAVRYHRGQLGDGR
jgi:hypothetical protein